MAVKRPDLDGLKFRMPGSDGVYLIDQGQKRGIPSAAVFDALFRDWSDIHLDINIDNIENGPPIPETAILFRCTDSSSVFFLDGVAPNQTKRGITSPAVMDRFRFSWQRINVWNAPLSSIGFNDGPLLTKEGRSS